MLSVLISTIFFLSCSNPVDFDQLNQYSSEQVFSLPFVVFTIDEANFDSTVEPVPSIFERSNFKILDGTFMKESLIQLEFDFEIKNGINRAFKIEIIFRELDFNGIEGREVHLLEFNVDAKNQGFTEKVFITKADSPDILNFLRVEIKLTLEDDSTPIDQADAGELEFNSGITVHSKAKF
ncbi:hypothetical protein BTO04_13615 [Polaribacter sp. SA4-10]|nr:hypothetical protein BTO04_13615 [Polaribacter sp. SA4-10]